MKLDKENLPFTVAVLIVLLFAVTPFVAAALLDSQAEYYGLGVGLWGLTMWFVYTVLGVTAGVIVAWRFDRSAGSTIMIGTGVGLLIGAVTCFSAFSSVT